MHAVIEIPAKSKVKYELDKETGKTFHSTTMPFHAPEVLAAVVSGIAPRHKSDIKGTIAEKVLVEALSLLYSGRSAWFHR